MSTNKTMKTFAINNSPVYEIMDEAARNSIKKINQSLETKLDKSDVGEIGSISVSKTEPTNESAEVWINPGTKENFSVPEIKDDTVNATDTWSSKKIESEISSLKSNIDSNTEDIKNNKILVDSNLENSGQAADAKVTGDAIASLKEDISNKITKFYASNQGENLADSDNGKIMDMMIYGKSSQDGTPSPENPVEIKSVVNPTVKVSNEDGTKSQTVTLPYTLNAIPVSSGGNVTIDGKQYIADYVDVERGKVVRMCKKEAVPNNCDWKLQKQSDGYKIGYLTSIFTDMGTTQFDSNKKAISNLGDSSKTWSNNFGFGKSGVFWINPYTNNGELTVNDINNFLTDHPMEVTYLLKTPIEEELTTEQAQALKELSTYYPVTNITVDSEQLYGYTAFDYPISMENGWNYVRQQLGDARDYIYDMDIQSAEAYVNSEYAVALTELEVM